MSERTLRHYMAVFITALAAFILVGIAYLCFRETFNGVKIITPLRSEFKVVNNTVRPGEVLYYEIHYRKFIDIPGEVHKQLIIEPKGGGKTVYIPLADVAGHLPVGEVRGLALVKIPEEVPEGKAKIKLSALYVYGLNMHSPTVVYTESFEIRK